MAMQKETIIIKQAKKKGTMEIAFRAILNKFPWQFLVCFINIFHSIYFGYKETVSEGTTVLFTYRLSYAELIRGFASSVFER